MSILPVMILASLLVVLGAVVAFFWAVENDQFDDLEFPAFLPLLDQPAASQTRQRSAADASAHEPGASLGP